MNVNINTGGIRGPITKVSRLSGDEYSDFCQHYQQCELVQNLLHQLNHLVQDVQRHRGISMGLLAGNSAFQDEFNSLQNTISRRLLMLDAMSFNKEMLLSAKDKENIRLAWDTIRCDWEGDKLTDNFELHSHFIEQLLLKILDLAKNIETPLIVSVDEEVGLSNEHPRRTKQIELLSFTCLLLPNMIENMAKIRGLASFSAAVGGAEYDHDRKLRYFLQCAREQNEKSLHCAQRLHTVLEGELSAIHVIRELETKFVHFIELVTHDILSGKTIQSSSSQLFRLATFIIDKYWEIVEEGLNVIRLWHRNDLESWISGS